MTDNRTSSTDEMMARIKEVQERYTDELMAKANVIGVGVGLRKRRGVFTQDPVLVVLVEKKVPLDDLALDDRIPSQIEDIPVDVQEVGIFMAE